MTSSHNGLAMVDQAAPIARRIRDAQTSLSANDRAIAAIILRDPFVAAFSTAVLVAGAAGVSKAAVARFGMRLGYAGYAALRQDLRNRWQERSEATQRSMDQDVEGRQLDGAGIVLPLLTSRLAQDVSSLSRLIEVLDPAAFTRCAELLLKPGVRIHVVGERRGFAVAAHALRLLRWLNRDARVFHTEELGLRLALAEIAAGHVVVVFAFRRYARTTGVVSRHARERGAHTILFTESLDCPFVAMADEVLLCPSAGNLLIESSIPAIFCFEALCDLMINRLGDRVETHVRRVHEDTGEADFDDADQTAEFLRRYPRRP
jgi:DNA-binding MurR/RpiR family transcriptional regulator